jgi:hypothetical protein
MIVNAVAERFYLSVTKVTTGDRSAVSGADWVLI